VTEILTFESTSLEDTNNIGKKIAQAITFPSCIYLHADMGMGKTTLCKSIISNLGCSQTVTSPTYNLVQEYRVEEGNVYHMDLYRLDDPSELEFLALPDLWSSKSVFLIEWPNNGDGFLQPATHEISIEKHTLSNTRTVVFKKIISA